MAKKVRLLLTQHNTGAWNMAVDEAVLEAVATGKQYPTLRFYGWNPGAVTIGYFQSLQEEVDTQKCQSEKIDVIRRITGGGAVFHDKEITYSFIVKEEDGLIVKDILASYKQICQGIISGLEMLGITSQFIPINDLVVNNKKISGNAQTRKQKTILQHGTVLLDVDVKKMFSLLKVPDEKIRDKMILAVEERVTSLRHLSGNEIAYSAVENALMKGFASALDIDIVLGILSEEEVKTAEKIQKEKYENTDWNGMR